MTDTPIPQQQPTYQNQNQGFQNQNQSIRRGRGSNLTSEHRADGGRNSPGNFKHDRQRAAEAGRRGAEARNGNR